MAVIKGKDSNGNELIDLREKVEVYATSAHPHLAEGSLQRCHPLVANKALLAGWATRETPIEKKPNKVVNKA